MPVSTRSKNSSWNPFAFVPAQVSFIATAVYIALAAVLLWKHANVPPAPSDPSPASGINLTQAWLDLDFITDGYHPWVSRRNTEVREYLVRRIEEILEHNGASYKVVEQHGAVDNDVVVKAGSGRAGIPTATKEVVVFKDLRSNATFVDAFRAQPWTVYAESENILVYIRGSADDEASDWWENNEKSYMGHGGVLVNAHYDSVSSGFGATDDGVGVVTVLQLISHFTSEGHRPKHGIVALLNDGEEDGLFGAYNFVRNPLSQFAHTFLNLEGAGAGGRAILFRSTDAEVTKFYAKSESPSGSVITADAFKRGLVRSGTDYSVFVDSLGLRGLDVAFFEPRSRYHTAQDDARDTSRASLWHMLSASLTTVDSLSSYDGGEFAGEFDANGRLDAGKGSRGVWFDLFGEILAVWSLQTLFSLSVSLLALGPVVLIVLQFVLTRQDRWYPMSRRRHLDSSRENEPIHFSGVRGLTRFPVAFVIATGIVYALAYLQAKINPYIIYSSEYTVWTMMLSCWFAVAWFFFAGADRVRPTALQRLYSLTWMYVLSWTILVFVAVAENNLDIASGYFFLVYQASIFVALLVSYLELFALPTKTEFVEHAAFVNNSGRRGSQSSRTLLSREGNRRRLSGAENPEEANERTSLLRGSNSNGAGGTFTGVADRQRADDVSDDEDPLLEKAFGDEQAWSSSLPRWTWVVQFFVLGPINVILVGQIALLSTAALRMTPGDGNAVLPIYLFIATFSVLLMLPLAPFMHRFKYQIPTFLFLVFIGCLVYNLLAFPFSRNAQLKFFFAQRVDLESGVNEVWVRGVEDYVQKVVQEIPSAINQQWSCKTGPEYGSGSGLPTCLWHGLHPNVISNALSDGMNNCTAWVEYNVSHHKNTAAFQVRGHNTKSCRLQFDMPVTSVQISGSAGADARFKSVAKGGSERVLLFGRTWDAEFDVNVSWSSEISAKGQTGEVACIWADANERGVIPAFDEVLRFAPVWSVATKLTHGLVEGFKRFEI